MYKFYNNLLFEIPPFKVRNEIDCYQQSKQSQGLVNGVRPKNDGQIYQLNQRRIMRNACTMPFAPRVIMIAGKAYFSCCASILFAWEPPM